MIAWAWQYSSYLVGIRTPKVFSILLLGPFGYVSPEPPARALENCTKPIPQLRRARPNFPLAVVGRALDPRSLVGRHLLGGEGRRTPPPPLRSAPE